MEGRAGDDDDDDREKKKDDIRRRRGLLLLWMTQDVETRDRIGTDLDDDVGVMLMMTRCIHCGLYVLRRMKQEEDLKGGGNHPSCQ